MPFPNNCRRQIFEEFGCDRNLTERPGFFAQNTWFTSHFVHEKRLQADSRCSPGRLSLGHLERGALSFRYYGQPTFPCLLSGLFLMTMSYCSINTSFLPTIFSTADICFQPGKVWLLIANLFLWMQIRWSVWWMFQLQTFPFFAGYRSIEQDSKYLQPKNFRSVVFLSFYARSRRKTLDNQIVLSIVSKTKCRSSIAKIKAIAGDTASFIWSYASCVPNDQWKICFF